MIADDTIARLTAKFLEVQGIGVRLDGFLAQQAFDHPELADDIGTLRSAITEAVSAGNLVPLVSDSLTGVFRALVAGRGETGKASAHFG